MVPVLLTWISMVVRIWNHGMCWFWDREEVVHSCPNRTPPKPSKNQRSKKVGYDNELPYDGWPCKIRHITRLRNYEAAHFDICVLFLLEEVEELLAR